MKILGIHHFAPPVAVVASRRLSGIYRYLQDRGAEVDIITSAQNEQRPQENSYRIKANFHFVGGKGLRHWLSNPSQPAVDSVRKHNTFFKWANRYRQSFPFIYFTDEGGPSYYKNALRLGKKIVAERKITHLFTSYRPWVDHRIGAGIKAAFPQLYWIADFRDLPVDPVRKDVGLTKYQVFFAKRVIQEADEIWVVSEGQKAQLAGWHPNINVVYNGLEQLPQPSNPPPADRFVINYGGSLYPGLQTISPLLSVLRSNELLAAPVDHGTHASLVKNISLQYSGKDAAVWHNWLKDLPTSLGIEYQTNGPSSQQLARKRQQSAGTNLLLSWSAPGYHGVLTAKLFDYLAAGRPVTVLVNGPDDPELRRIIEGSGAGKVFGRGQSKELAEWLVFLMKKWEENDGRLPWQIQTEKLRYLSWEEQLKGLPSRK